MGLLLCTSAILLLIATATTAAPLRQSGESNDQQYAPVNASVCSTFPLPTIQFNVNSGCNGIAIFASSNCWLPQRLPMASDTVIFPAGTNVTDLSQAYQYDAQMSVANVFVSFDAQVTVTGIWIVTNCLVVEGALVLLSKSDWGYGVSAYVENCAPQWGGFTPRVCGGADSLLSIASGGRVVVNSFYASVSINVVVNEGAALVNAGQGYFWSNVTNYGTISSRDPNIDWDDWGGVIFVNGVIYNYGELHLGNATTLDGLAGSNNLQLVIINHGRAVICGDIASNSNATFTIVNYNDLTFQPLGYWAIAQTAYPYVQFQLNNIGTTRWLSLEYAYPPTFFFTTSGVFVNSGTFIANGSTVYLATYDGWGGKLVTLNGGVFSYGQQSIDQQALCVDAEDKLVENWRVTGRFGSHDYPAPYAWGQHFSNPRAATRQSGSVTDAIRQLKPLPCTAQFAFHASPKPHVIEGDGSGSVVFAVPLLVQGDVLVRNGGRLYSVAEHFSTPFFGGGGVTIGRKGELTLGIEADLSCGGRLTISNGGILRVPVYASVRVTNHSVSVAKGGELRLEGALKAAKTPGGLSTLHMCGARKGRGSLAGEDQC